MNTSRRGARTIFEGEVIYLKPVETAVDWSILVRYGWLGLSPTAARMKQSFYDDGGKTWEANWICELSRPAP